ncbi:hypothetical protein DV735_g2538, partial [Chaetothyriales sp. CBS 134920]
MTSTSLDLSLVEVAQYVSGVLTELSSQLRCPRSLDLSQVPSKFRCTACTNFLVNAWKFGCCDVKFCESCYEASAGTSCPQCGMKLNPGICEPAASTRKTIKAWLKTEKDKAKSTIGEPAPSVDEHLGSVAANGENKTSEQAEAEPAAPAADVLASVEDAEHFDENLDDDGGDPQSDPTDPGDDDIEIQVEPTAEEQEWLDQQRRAAEEQQEQYDEQSQKQQRDANTPPTQQQQQQQSEDLSKQQNSDMTNSMSFNNMNMDMMQQMQQMMASGMNPMAMMGMPMGMNPMAMFGGMNGMNGMNMGMNFNPNQMSQMFGFQNNNMWQNSNSNAFSNGLGGDFQYGFNSNQQQYYSNDDFQAYRARPYGRGGRGRGRGGFGRGRGNFRQFQDYAPNSHNQHEQQQFDPQSMPRHSHNNHQQNRRHPQQESIDLTKQEDDHQDLAEFAPGGQDEIQDALGDEYHAKTGPTTASAEPQPTAKKDASNPGPDKEEEVAGTAEPMSIDQPEPEARSEETEAHSSAAVVERPVESDRGPIAEAYEEDLDHAMPPPSAPSGPSGRQADREFGFRGRGHGRFVSRSRGSSHLSNGHPPSPVGSQLPQSIPRPDSAGAGVVGAPTGPRAMREPREPAPKPAPRPQSNGGGISILGRASRETAGLPDRTRSPLSNSHANQRDQEKSSRRQSRREEEAQYDAEREDGERERRRKKSTRRDDYDDYAMDEDDDYSQDRRSSHKSRREREKYSSSTKHHSSHSRRHRDEAEDEYDTNDYGEPVRDSDGKRRHRSSRHRDHDDKSRNRDRTKDRKHSRHDPDREEEDAYAEERRHTKRRREHREATLEVNGRSNSHRSSEVATPTAATPTAEALTDPYAAEREAAIRERQLKEQQRRDNAKSSKSSTTAFARRVSYKYEDEAERGMLESERAVSAARWR